MRTLKDCMKKNLLVSLADKNYVEQAKQFFSTVFFNSGWQGDYMLLSDDLKDEDRLWFEKKGIIVYSPPLLSSDILTPSGHIPLNLSKIFLFTEDFKERWETIIFYDSDVIVRASLDKLLKCQGLSAPSDKDFLLKDEFYNDKLDEETKNKLDLNKKSFCAGCFSLKTEIISKETFSELLKLFNSKKEIFKNGDEALLNLYFYDKWNEIPFVYNFPVNLLGRSYGIKEKKNKTAAIHFIEHPKPWKKESPYYQEWRANLEMADKIDLKKRLAAKKTVSDFEIALYSIYICFKKTKTRIKTSLRKTYKRIDRFIGLIGQKIKARNPRLYEVIKFKK